MEVTKNNGRHNYETKTDQKIVQGLRVNFVKKNERLRLKVIFVKK